MANHTLDDYCYALRTELHLMRNMNTTFTSLSNRTKDFWKSSRGTVIRIEVLVVVITIMQLFLVIFGSWRRRSRNFFIQKGVLAAYSLSSSLISYTLGSMQSSAAKSNMYIVWAISLYMLSACADSITAYSLTDNSQLTRQIYQSALGYSYAFLIMSSVADLQPRSAVRYSLVSFISLSFLISAALLSCKDRLGACRMASASWNLNKMVADYMYQEHIKSGSSYYDPTRMIGYHYPVDCIDIEIVQEQFGAVTSTMWTKDKLVDIEMVWKNNTLSQDLKDLCLAFSLFHLLRRRFFGFECAESSLQKTHDFVFKGLLSKKDIDGDGAAIVDYDRVFKVIEVELAFMYDFFFTKYAVIYWTPLNQIFQLLTAITVVIVIAILMAGGFLLGYKAADVAIALMVLGSIAFLQVVLVLHYRMTIWSRVSFACRVVRRRGCYWMRFEELLAKIGLFVSTRFHNEQKLGQYSLLKSLSDHSNQSIVIKVLASFLLRLRNNCSALNIIPRFIYREFLGKRKPGKPIKLPVQVKKALVQCLERTQGILTNGESSLLSSRALGAAGLLWACTHYTDLHTSTGCCSQRKEKQAVYIILTWHIATCYCEMGANGLVREELKEHHGIATILSKYCAYLVVSAPKLLPGHHYDTRCISESVVEEAMVALENVTDIYEAMRRLPELNSREANETVFQKSVRLGKQLEEMEEGARWKVLAEFWAEMLLYLAPSDNVKEHVEYLAKGGEFITQLWALLTHAGILHRGQRNVIGDDIENPGDVGDTRDSGTDQQDPSELPYGSALRLRQASSYLDKCAEGASTATALRGRIAQTVEMMVHQPADPVQNGEGARNESNGLSEIEEWA